MKLVKVVFAAVAFLVGSSAMASVGDFRSTGEELREGQLICRQMDGSNRKQASVREEQYSAPASRDVAESSATVTAN
jgi:hypothetical protein